MNSNVLVHPQIEGREKYFTKKEKSIMIEKMLKRRVESETPQRGLPGEPELEAV